MAYYPAEPYGQPMPPPMYVAPPPPRSSMLFDLVTVVVIAALVVVGYKYKTELMGSAKILNQKIQEELSDAPPPESGDVRAQATADLSPELKEEIYVKRIGQATVNVVIMGAVLMGLGALGTKNFKQAAMLLLVVTGATVYYIYDAWGHSEATPWLDMVSGSSTKTSSTSAPLMLVGIGLAAVAASAALWYLGEGDRTAAGARVDMGTTFCAMGDAGCGKGDKISLPFFALFAFYTAYEFALYAMSNRLVSPDTMNVIFPLFAIALTALVAWFSTGPGQADRNKVVGIIMALGLAGMVLRYALADSGPWWTAAGLFLVTSAVVVKSYQASNVQVGQSREEVAAKVLERTKQVATPAQVVIAGMLGAALFFSFQLFWSLRETSGTAGEFAGSATYDASVAAFLAIAIALVFEDISTRAPEVRPVVQSAAIVTGVLWYVSWEAPVWDAVAAKR